MSKTKLELGWQLSTGLTNLVCGGRREFRGSSGVQGHLLTRAGGQATQDLILKRNVNKNRQQDDSLGKVVAAKTDGLSWILGPT